MSTRRSVSIVALCGICIGTATACLGYQSIGLGIVWFAVCFEGVVARAYPEQLRRWHVTERTRGWLLLIVLA